MRLPLATATSCLALTLTLALVSCGSGSSGGGDVSAKKAEATYVASVRRAVHLVARTVAAADVDVVGGWESCMGGYRYRGTGAVDAGAASDDSQLEQVRKALTGAGYSDVTQVPGHVSVEDGDLALDIVRPGTARPRQWTLSFRSDCRILHGEDKDYAEQSRDRRFTDLRA